MFVAFSTAVKASYMRVPLPGNGAEPSVTRTTEVPFKSLCLSGANAGGRAFCHELDIGWVHIVQWIFSILAISAGLFWRKSVFCVFTL